MEWLYENGLWSFVFLTVILGGAAAFMSGRNIAQAWKSRRLLAFYCFLLACAVRFLHYALFEGTLLSTKGLAIDLIVMLAAGFLGYRLMRVTQMVTQYRWLYKRSAVFWWQSRTGT